FGQRLKKADALMEEIRPRSKNYPAWYSRRITILLDLGRKAEARKIFEEGARRFPEYQKIYLSMARAYEPKWGGSEESYEEFANEAARMTHNFEGMGMYARIYAKVDGRYGIPFDPENSEFPSWEKLHAGYEDLMKKYPNSNWNMNMYASVACRSNDSALYRR